MRWNRVWRIQLSSFHIKIANVRCEQLPSPAATRDRESMYTEDVVRISEAFEGLEHTIFLDVPAYLMELQVPFERSSSASVSPGVLA